MKRVTGAARTTEVSARERQSEEIAYQAALEGIVLLENRNHALPLRPGRIALYGAGAERTVKGGTGSGEVNERHSISIREGLERNGFEICSQDWLEDYDRAYRAAFDDAEKIKLTELLDINIMDHLPSLPIGREITEEDIAKSGCDTAVYVVARQAGEGADKKLDKGEFDLSQTEIANIRRIASAYQNSILIINAGSYMNLSSIADCGLSALIFYCQQGMQGGRALADILSGKVSPSGKLTDTWAKAYDDIPTGKDFSYLSGDTTQEYYREGIYVGYRYFDTWQIEPRYHFGYGLSYTEFSVEGDAALEGEQIRVTATVKNIGNAGGKEVVQVYVSAPDGGLKKEYQRLVAFAKTEEVKAGNEQCVTLSFSLRDLASYSEERDSYILEKGSYVIRLGNASNQTRPIAVLALDETAIVSRHRNICARETPLEEMTPVVRAVEDDLTKLPVLRVSAASIQTEVIRYDAPENLDDPRVNGILKSLSVREMIELCVGPGFMGLMSSNKVFTPGAVGRTTDRLFKKGLINVNLSDGPAGLRLMKVSATGKKTGRLKFVKGNNLISIMDLMPEWLLSPLRANEKADTIYYQYTTAFPVGTALAQSWNVRLCEEVGKAISREMREYLVTFWLGPAMNIHRNPLCGRNFEYLSEDPLLTGKIAAAIVRGVHSIPGNYATIKHFACNNAEENRNHSNSNVNERALREIYLKGFEIAVKEAAVKAVMTSYNLINGVYTNNSHDLCTEVLRCEWGFDGVVMTDWWATGKDTGRCDAAIKAGNDLIMPGSGAGKKELEKGLREGTVTKGDLEKACANIIRSIIYSDVAKNDKVKSLL